MTQVVGPRGLRHSGRHLLASGVGTREHGVNVAAWVRSIHLGKVRLNDEKRARLKELPGWTWNRHDWAKNHAITTHDALSDL